MTGLPSWSDFALLLGGVGGAVAWIDSRIGTSRENKNLRDTIDEAKSEVLKAQQAAETAVNEKNAELAMIREDRDQWRDRALYWQDQAQHFEMLAAQRGGPG